MTTDNSTTRLDWAIIGGGIHGVHLAVRLIGEANVKPEQIRIIDPGPALLHSWQRCSANTGMRHLRSPAVHHLDLDPWSLLRFAEAKGSRKKPLPGLFASPYGRPSLALFAEHSADVVSRFGLQELHVQDRATRIGLSCDGVEITLSAGGSLHADRVLLAMGTSAQPQWPVWASNLLAHGVRIHHVFEPNFSLDPDAWPDRVAVIGGGISAAQVAMRLADGTRQVHLLSRHGLRKHQFDSDPGWVGPKNMRRFSATRSLSKRRKMITDARHVGSVPPDVYRALRSKLDRSVIQRHQGAVGATVVGSEVVMWSDQEPVRVDAVLLATGFEGQRPGGRLVDELITSEALPCADCGFPVVDAHLRWHPRVFVTGPLAELELGPVSRNIVGARRAAERIVPIASAG